MPGSRTHGTVSYRHPADIDGEPEEVAAAALASLADITQATYEVANAAFALVRNAALETNELSGDSVLEWERSPEGRILERVTDLTGKVRRAASSCAAKRPG